MAGNNRSISKYKIVLTSLGAQIVPVCSECRSAWAPNPIYDHLKSCHSDRFNPPPSRDLFMMDLDHCGVNTQVYRPLKTPSPMSGVPVYQGEECGECGECFLQEDELTRHIRSKHRRASSTERVPCWVQEVQLDLDQVVVFKVMSEDPEPSPPSSWIGERSFFSILPHNH